MNVSRELISKVTDGVMDDVRAWQSRPLDDVYPVVFFDAFILKIRENGSVQRKACYLAFGVRLDGERDVLGMWFQDAEGAKFWMHVLGDLKRRGVRDILICWVDGLTGFPEAIEATFPETTVQTCVVHLIRRSLRYVPRRELEKVARTSNRSTPPATLTPPGPRWRRSIRNGKRFPPVVQAWQDTWEHFTPFLRFEDEVRRVVYTTNAIEALNRQLRKAMETKGHFPSEDAARKLIYLAIQNATPQWTRTRAWTKALLAFKIEFGNSRLPGRNLTPRNRQLPAINLQSSQHRPHTSADTLRPARNARTRSCGGTSRCGRQ